MKKRSDARESGKPSSREGKEPMSSLIFDSEGVHAVFRMTCQGPDLLPYWCSGNVAGWLFSSLPEVYPAFSWKTDQGTQLFTGRKEDLM